LSTTVPDTAASAHGELVASSYRQLAEIYHDLLSREDLDQVLDRLVKTVRHLIPVASILIAEAHTEGRVLQPLVAEGGWPDGFLESRLPFGEGLIGLAAERGRPILCNDAHLDPRAGHVAGTPVGEPEAIISVPLVARGIVIGAMSLYREGPAASFSEFDFELAQRFADAATIAIENARTRAELRDLGRRDALTSLFNRRGFNELLASALSHVADSPVSLVLLDLDDFKSVNDLHGHVCGDEVLAEVGRVLDQAVAGGGAVCRLGGDEFAVILSGGTTGADAAALVGRIQHALEHNLVTIGSAEIRQCASIGFASTEDLPAPTAEDLLREADRVMYSSKRERQPVRLKLVADASA
jgi:diguanylate cyclase (GGDEF)-like protein